jgi:hypothetical protein
MSDQHRDDDPIEAPPPDEPTSRRRSEPTTSRWSEPSPVDVPQACCDAAAHVASCPRCLAALRAHIDHTIAALLGAATH